MDIGFVKELKGHSLLAVERYRDSTRWMVEFTVLRAVFKAAKPGNKIRLFLSEEGHNAALASQKCGEIKIWRQARVVEGHIIDVGHGKRRRR